MKMFLVCIGSAIALATEPVSSRFLVHLLDYIAIDYPESVSNGKVLNQLEYDEQLDFVRTLETSVTQIPELHQSIEVQSDLVNLRQLIEAKAHPDRVAQMAHQIEKQIRTLSSIAVAPRFWPDRENGHELYEKNCTSCHGVNGHGDGRASGGLDPKPTNFHDATRMDSLSPFQLFNAIRLGVPGTAMAAFDPLKDEEIWDLAFYVAGLRYEKIQPNTLEPIIDLERVASTPDKELRSSFQENEIASFRLHQASQTGQGAFIAFTKQCLQDALAALRSGNRVLAKQKSVEAYLEGVEPIEPKLSARDFNLTVLLEQRMADVRSAIDGGATPEQVALRIQSANETLSQSEKILEERIATPWLIYTLSSGIVLREAFEAVLIVITVLGVLKSIGSTSGILAVHAGWVLAFLFGTLLWFFSGLLISLSGAGREFLEGVVSLLAVGVLLYFGFWLHQTTEIGRWRSFLNSMAHSATGRRNLIALGLVSFLGVFREAFETVLFLRAVSLEATQNQQWIIGAAVLSTLLFTFIVCAFALKWSARIPVRQLFSLSSIVMVILAFTLIGKAIHAFQESGYLRITPLPIPFRFDFIGLYPTYETLVTQIFILLVVILVWTKGIRYIQSNNSRQPLG